MTATIAAATAAKKMGKKRLRKDGGGNGATWGRRVAGALSRSFSVMYRKVEEENEGQDGEGEWCPSLKGSFRGD